VLDVEAAQLLVRSELLAGEAGRRNTFLTTSSIVILSAPATAPPFVEP
jgi:hypothetical protein